MWSQEGEICLQVEKGNFIVAITLMNIQDKYEWQWIVVYGPVKDELRESFLDEISMVVKSFSKESCICADFNTIRSEHEKNNDNINWGRIYRFNDCIQDLGRIEIRSSGLWSNKQSNMILEVLDRCFVSSKWEDRFPLCVSKMIPCVFPDHKPVLLDTGGEVMKPPYKFRYERWCELEDNFYELEANKWKDCPNKESAMDNWHDHVCYIRNF